MIIDGVALCTRKTAGLMIRGAGKEIGPLISGVRSVGR